MRRFDKKQNIAKVNLLSEQRYLTEKSSGEIFDPSRNQPIKFKHPEISDELFNLINTAYAPIGGHVKVQKPEDIANNSSWDFWEGIDIHGSNDFDIILFGKKTQFGVKFSGVGHDGTSQAKRAYINARTAELKQPGHYIEVSGRIAEILIGNGVPIVTDPEIINKVLGKEVNFTGEYPGSENMPGDGWYIRNLGGHDHAKILVGKPNA
jgi:hypothetical protein